MAYVDPLDPLTPAGSDGIVNGDDRIRELKRALIQRLSTVFVDTNADPLQLKTTAIGAQSEFTNIATAVAQVILTMTAQDALYMVFAFVEAGNSADVSFAWARSSTAANYTLWGETKPAGSLVALTSVGADILATQTTGSNKDIHSVVLRVY